MSEGKQITINIFNFGQNMFYMPPSGSNDHSNDDDDSDDEYILDDDSNDEYISDDDSDEDMISLFVFGNSLSHICFLKYIHS